VNNRTFPVLYLSFSTILTACPADELTTAEAKDAVVEVAVASQASTVAEGTIELTTSFSLGVAVEQAAQEIAEFAASQVDCAEIEQEGATVTIRFGVEQGCEYHGMTYTGSHSVTVARADEGDVLVEHTWEALSNGRVEVSGSAQVSWTSATQSRRVVHELEWTRLADGRAGTGTGDRTQSALDGAWADGIVLSGSRSWSGAAGDWDLSIDNVEWRWADPVPQSGTYTLTTPDDDELTLAFSRLDEDTVLVSLAGARRDLEFRVSSQGEVEE
jgi:hypothetical protein